jgi:parallel beta-helix repeat protein
MKRSFIYPLAAVLIGCAEQPAAPRLANPTFTVVGVTDPTTVLIVDGVTVPRNVTVTGDLAGIVVVVDRATVDLSHARVDCSQQPPSPDTIGVWIQGNRSRVHVTGGGTGVVTGCHIGVLIGQFDPTSPAPGGSSNHVNGLLIQNSFGGTADCFLQSCAIAISNSHDNVVDHNTITQATEGGIVVSGSNRDAAVSGNNTIANNTIAGVGDFGIIVSTDGNTVSNNVVVGWFWDIAVTANRNHIASNQVGYLEVSCGCIGVWLEEGADSNFVTRNVELEKVGNNGDTYFLVEATARNNLLSKNLATTTKGLDALDRSGDCINNKWSDNTFTSRDPACIR